MTETNNHNLVYISLVTIVAIVAMVVLINGNGQQTTPNQVYTASENTAGQASYSTRTFSNSNNRINYATGVEEKYITPTTGDCIYCCNKYSHGNLDYFVNCDEGQQNWLND